MKMNTRIIDVFTKIDHLVRMETLKVESSGTTFDHGVVWGLERALAVMSIRFPEEWAEFQPTSFKQKDFD